MKNLIHKVLSNIGLKNIFLIPHGEKGIAQVGHRKYVGGMWEEIGRLQFDFLIENGLKPDDIFLDIACGSLRAGVHLIPYLNKGNYLGIEKERALIELAIKHEIEKEIINLKFPEFVVSDSFEFHKFNKTPNFAIAQSLFTHLPKKYINLCFKNLKNHFHPDGVFYATFLLTDNKTNNPESPHDNLSFKYTINEIREFGYLNGWDFEFVDIWEHPRRQKIFRFTVRS